MSHYTSCWKTKELTVIKYGYTQMVEIKLYEMVYDEVARTGTPVILLLSIRVNQGNNFNGKDILFCLC